MQKLSISTLRGQENSHPFNLACAYALQTLKVTFISMCNKYMKCNVINFGCKINTFLTSIFCILTLYRKENQAPKKEIKRNQKEETSFLHNIL